MALHVPATGRLCALLARAASLAEGGGACGARPAPACPACRAAPQPACRARPATERRAQRVVCCAPPQGARPPCAPPRPACSLTCRDYLGQIRQRQGVEELLPLKESSDWEQDPVAERLQHAKRARRAEYERDVALRAAQPQTMRAPPSALYRLGGERECARATDGCLYMMPRVGAPPTPPRCGPGRTPPPPRCVQLAPDDGCTIKGDAHLDPCAHRPRVMIEIDRSANTTPPPPPPPLAPNRTVGGGRGAARAGDFSWCKSLPPPAPAPRPCRRSSIVERLRARSVPRLPPSQNERRLHTSVQLPSKAGKSISSVSGGIDDMLNSKQQLKEAGLGRVVVDVDADRARQTKSQSGSLELAVPVGTERVTVLVSLDGAGTSGGACAKTAPVPAASTATCSKASTNITCAPRNSSSSPRNCFTAAPSQRDTWLSIKKLKKLTRSRCDGETTEMKSGLTPARAPQRCGRSSNDSTRETKRSLSKSTFLANAA